MKKLSLAVLALAFLVGSVPAQTIPPLTAIDFSDAKLSQAGPESFYVRNVIASGDRVSLTISLGDEGRWALTNIIPEEENQIPSDVVLDFVTIEALGDSRLQIDGIIYGDRILTGILPVDQAETPGLTEIQARPEFAQGAPGYSGTLRDLLLGRFVAGTEEELAEVRAEYEERLANLRERIAEIEEERDSLREQNNELEAQLENLRMENEALAARLESLEENLEAVPEGTISLPEELAREYLEAIGALEAEIRSLTERISEIESTVADAESDGTAAEIAELRSTIESLRARGAEIDTQARERLLEEGFIALLRPALTEGVISGFEGSEVQLGEWTVEGDRASQDDRNMLFGKLLLPAVQGSSPVLYRFTARSTDPVDQWVGLGLHIYVENVQRRGYGLGDSLLVWLTRDREVYGTDTTHLQLYRSDDDINMGRVMDALVSEPLTDGVDVEVLYEPVRQYITIAVDGEEKIRYKTWFGVEEGVSIALRSLGTAEFTNLEVVTVP
jgi:hypothetical protein